MIFFLAPYEGGRFMKIIRPELSKREVINACSMKDKKDNTFIIVFEDDTVYDSGLYHKWRHKHYPEPGRYKELMSLKLCTEEIK